MSIKSKDSKHSKETASVSLTTNFESLALQELAKYSEAELQTLIVEPLL